MQLILLLLIGGGSCFAQPISTGTCSLGFRQQLPLSETHTYFLQCLQFDTYRASQGLSLMSCMQVEFDKNVSGTVNVNQNCGAGVLTQTVTQTLILNASCAEGTETRVTVTNGANAGGVNMNQLQGCWEKIRTQSFITGSLLAYSSSNRIVYGLEQVGLDSTSGSSGTRCAYGGITLSLVFFLLSCCFFQK
jgi:hypothetical protein